MDKNEWWPSGEYVLELWDTGPHQDPARKKRDNRQANRHAKFGQKKKKNGKSAKGKIAVQETK
jgi:hypothetical protein